jgi:hypothetical protein
VQALGRTKKGYGNKQEGAQTHETVENREGLHSLLIDCLVGANGTLLGSFGLSIVTGSAAQGKLMSARSCYPPVPEPPYWVKGTKGAHAWRERAEVKTAAILVEEERMRSASTHLLLLLGVAKCPLLSSTPEAAAALLDEVTLDDVTNLATSSGIRRLQPYYGRAWSRMLHMHSDSGNLTPLYSNCVCVLTVCPQA